jgi:multiple sugar transport system ATP-binding protein
MAYLSIDNVYKSFGAVEVLKGINIEAAEGEFLVLVGPSGCGKSTLLNLIAGLESITKGEISIKGRVVNNVAPKDRDIAMVFQSYALYPNMNVRQNLSFGLETRKVPKPEIKRTIARVAGILQIEDLLDRKPSQLSGGQRQRVAMGRAIARNPAIFLFDEPLSNLDAKLRVDMRTEIKKLHQRLKASIVYVTHDQIEAMTLADRIAIMKDGVLQQLGTPHKVYNQPANLFVAGFIGSPSMNFLPVTLAKTSQGEPGLMLRNDAGQNFELPIKTRASGKELGRGRELILGLRPENITTMALGANGNGTARIKCQIKVVEPTGPDTLVYVGINGKDVVCRVPPDEVSRPDESLSLSIELAKAHFFDPQSGERVAL